MNKTNSLLIAFKRLLLAIAAALVLLSGSLVYRIHVTASPSFISAPTPRPASVDTFFIPTLNAATGTGTEVQLGGANQVCVEYEISTGVTSGVVVLEHSAVSGYTGTWANLDTETVGSSFATAPSKTFFTYPGPMGFIRARITTTFSGGGSPLLTVRVKRMFGQ